MASCPGRKGNSRCLSTLYRCKKCGNVGCDQSSEGNILNPFKSGHGQLVEVKLSA